MLDISKSPMEVAPTAHYSMGGVLVDPKTQSTRVLGLYAAGECTAGLHGANRLGGNSLAEILVFGKIAGEEAADFSDSLELQIRDKSSIVEANNQLDLLTSEGKNLARPLQRKVRDIMWKYCGVVRTGDDLAIGLEKLKKVREASNEIDVRPSAEGYIDLALALDLLGSIESAEATMKSALLREESRGAHQRIDYPDLSDKEIVNYIVELEKGVQKTGKRKVKSVRSELIEPLSKFSDLGVDGRLLE